MLNSGGMGSALKEACWGGGTSVPEVILSEQELHQLEEHDQCVQSISAADLYLLYH